MKYTLDYLQYGEGEWRMLMKTQNPEMMEKEKISVKKWMVMVDRDEQWWMYPYVTLCPVYIQHLHSRHWAWPGARLNWSNACHDTQCSHDLSSVLFLVHSLGLSFVTLFWHSGPPPDNHHCCATDYETSMPTLIIANTIITTTYNDKNKHSPYQHA